MTTKAQSIKGKLDLNKFVIFALKGHVERMKRQTAETGRQPHIQHRTGIQHVQQILVCHFVQPHFLQRHVIITLMRYHRNLSCLYQLTYGEIGFVIVSFEVAKPIDDVKGVLIV